MKLKKIRYYICAVLGLFALALTGNGIKLIDDVRVANGDSVESVFTFDGLIEKVETDYTFKDYFMSDTATGNTDKGLAVFSSTSGATVAYNKTINFSALTADDPIMEVYTLYGDGFETISNLKFTFYDAADESNNFSVAFYESTAAIKPVYARVEYKGRSVGFGSESSNYMRLMEGMYGCLCPNFGYVGAQSYAASSDGKVNPFAVSIDYEERKVYAYGCLKSTSKYLVMDLDDPTVFSEKDQWKGFTNDIGRVEVSFELNRKATAGIVIKSVMGGTLNGSLTQPSDYPTPIVFLDNDAAYAEEMPLCGVDVAYKIPNAYAYDWYFGQLNNVTTEVFAYDGATGEYSNDKTTFLKDGYFTCDVEGDYRVVYTASNGKNTAVAYLDFTAVEKLPTLTIGMDGEFEKPFVFESVYVPETYAYGGSGIITKTESLIYNGKEIEMPDNRTVYLEESGYLTLRVEAVSYSGVPAVRNFVLTIPDMTALKVQGVPLSIQSGVATTFPAGYAYDTATGESVDVTVMVDGEEMTDGLTYTTTKTEGVVRVVYSANERTYAYDLPVLKFSENVRPSEYLLESAKMDLKDSNQGVVLTANESGASAYWAYPMVTGAASYSGVVNLLAVKDSGKFDYVDVVLTDYENTASSAFIRIFTEGNDDDTKAYVQYNGVGEKALVYGSLVNTTARTMSLEFNTTKGYVYDKYSGNALLKMVGYTAKLSKVELRFGNVNGAGSVCLMQIGNQELSSSTNKTWSDKAVAVANYEFELKKNDLVDVGTKIRVPNARAYDLRSNVASVSVSVKAKLADGSTESVTLDENNQFVCEKFGEYTISFKIQDGSNTYYDRYVYRSVDVISPELTLEKTIQSEVKVGTTIVIPKATATDNIDGECSVFIYVQYVADFSKEIVFMDEEYTFTKTGKYRICYVTHDECANYTRCIVEVEVVKE